MASADAPLDAECRREEGVADQCRPLLPAPAAGQRVRRRLVQRDQRPAYRHASEEQLRKAVSLGRAALAGVLDLEALNRKSLRWRRKAAAARSHAERRRSRDDTSDGGRPSGRRVPGGGSLPRTLGIGRRQRLSRISRWRIGMASMVAKSVAAGMADDCRSLTPPSFPISRTTSSSAPTS